MLKVQLFGTGRASYLGKPLPGFPHQQPCLLLCYLFLNNPYPHSREQLASIFWGDNSTQVARKCLRNALWRLRQNFQEVGAELDHYLLVNEDYLSILGGGEYWLDTETFDKTDKKYKNVTGHDLDKTVADELEYAVALYTGDLLEGVYDECFLYERERFRLAYLNMVDKLLEYHAGRHNFELSIACGERILSLDKTREKVHRQMMALYCLAGERNAAVAQYKRCKQILREELDIEPMTETRQLNKMIASGQFNPESWIECLDTPLLSDLLARDALQPLAKHSLKKLRHLQKMVDETGEELRLLERLISHVLAQTDQYSPPNLEDA